MATNQTNQEREDPKETARWERDKKEANARSVDCGDPDQNEKDMWKRNK